MTELYKMKTLIVYLGTSLLCLQIFSRGSLSRDVILNFGLRHFGWFYLCVFTEGMYVLLNEVGVEVMAGLER